MILKLKFDAEKNFLLRLSNKKIQSETFLWKIST